MMTHSSIQSKVGPSTRRASLFPGAAPKTTPNPAPKSTAPKKKPKSQLPKYYDPRDRLPEDAVQGSYIQQRRPDLFLLVVGLVCVGLGIGLTWYGDHENLQDFLVIGPGCLIIGTAMITVALVMICQDIRRKRKRSRVTTFEQGDTENDDNRSVVPDYLLPVGLPVSDDLNLTREPSALELYGDDGSKKSKHCSDKSTAEPPNLAQPVYHEHGNEQTEVEVYHVPLPVVAEVTQNHPELQEDRLENHDTKEAKSQRVSSANSNITTSSKNNPYELGMNTDEEALMRELTDMELYGERCSTTMTVLTDVTETLAVVHPVAGVVQ